MLQLQWFTRLTSVRNLQTTTCLQKQPPHDRQRRRRKIVPPFQKLPTYDEDPLKNLKLEHIFSKHIPGAWGSTDPEVKKKFFKTGQALVEESDLYKKLNELYYHENNLWYHKLRVPLEAPETLEFSQYITRTNLLPASKMLGCPELPSSVENVLLSRIHEFQRSHHLKPKATSETRRHYLAEFMDCVYLALVEFCPDSHLRRADNQIDSGAKIETFFKRIGFADLFAENEDARISEGVWERTEETVLDAENMLRFRVLGQLAWQLRSKSPLPPLVGVSNATCRENNLPIDGSRYRPEVFGLEPTNHYDFSCLPFVNTGVESPDYIRTVAGYWTESPFWPLSGGDPCMFGLLGVLDVTDLASRAMPFDDVAIGRQVVARDSLSQGILTAFAWTSAMAYNQGFTLYNELDRPFSAQLLLFDGVEQTWQLVAYQLNSLCGLWKAEDASVPLNVAWHSDPIPLQQEGGSGLNAEAIRLLSTAMLRAPETAASSELHCRRLIPASTEENEEVVEQVAMDEPHRRSTRGPDDVLTAAEHEALLAVEGNEASRRRHPPRVPPRPTPHPNEVFFLKMTQRDDLLQEFREKMPAFGGPRTPAYGNSDIPLASREVIRRYKHRRRTLTPQDKVIRLPPRWR